ncbi:MAG: hypothetical protein MK312_03055, partial [Roseibacillus sp.]|nr:hypothetical protein [Roseibacillus sp.]
MALYQYKALQSDGAITQGDLEAGGRQDAFRQIESLGLKTIHLTEKSGKGDKAKGSSSTASFSWGSGKVTCKLL